MSIVINDQTALVEITRAAIQTKGEVCLKSKGNCMWPVLRSGDAVTISEAPYKNLRFGDIAIFQTTPGTFHANILFRNPGKDTVPANYLGKVRLIERHGKVYNLDARSAWQTLLGTLICPSNPYGLGLPAYVLKKLRRSFQPQK